jgi:hypothetical protein
MKTLKVIFASLCLFVVFFAISSIVAQKDAGACYDYTMMPREHCYIYENDPQAFASCVCSNIFAADDLHKGDPCYGVAYQYAVKYDCLAQ